MQPRASRVVGHPDVGPAFTQLIESARFCRSGIGRRQHSEFAARRAVIPQSWHQRRDAASADKGHHDIDAISRMDFCENLVADARLPRCIRQ